MAEHSHLSQTDPELVPFVDALLAQPEIYDVPVRRAQFASAFGEIAKKAYGPGLPQENEYRLNDFHVDVENGSILVRSLVPTPEDAYDDKTYPLMFWIHGGGWTTGMIEMDDYQLRAICVEFRVSILNVDYRLVPEHPHPTPLNDCYSALKWATEHPELFGADLKKGFIVAGMSVGGHIATVIAHRARDDPFFQETPLTGQILQAPILLHPDAVPEKFSASLLSWEQNANAPVLTAEAMRWNFGHLGGNPEDPEASPLLYPSHKDIVPAVIQVCGLDILRDEALLYDQLLRDDGVKTKLTIYPGVPHAFEYLFPSFKQAKKWEEDYRSGIRWLLDGAP